MKLSDKIYHYIIIIYIIRYIIHYFRLREKIFKSKWFLVRRRLLLSQFSTLTFRRPKQHRPQAPDVPDLARTVKMRSDHSKNWFDFYWKNWSLWCMTSYEHESPTFPFYYRLLILLGNYSGKFIKWSLWKVFPYIFKQFSIQKIVFSYRRTIETKAKI